MCLLRNRIGRTVREPRLFHRFGRPATKTILGIGLATAMHLGHSTDNIAYGQIDHYEPFVVVDVADLADPTNDADLVSTSRGETADVNDELFACGWYEDSNSEDRPFFLNPLDGGEAYELPMSTYDSGRALALNDPASYDLADIIVVGWVGDGTNGPRAAYWDHNGTSWSLHLVPSLSTKESKAFDIDQYTDQSGTTTLVGGSWLDTSPDPDVWRPFDSDLDQTTNLWTSIEGEVRGVYSDDVLAGTRSDAPGTPSPAAFHYDIPNTTITYLEHEYGVSDEYEETYGVAVNGFNDVAGYGVDDDTSAVDGLLWYYDSGTSTWSLVRLYQDNPDPVDSTLTDVADKDDGTVDIVGTYVAGGAFYVTVSSSGSYKSYSLDAVTSGGLAHRSFVLFPLRIRRNVEDLSWTPATYSANGINGIATIAGSYDDGNPSGSKVRPCLFVANDFDNNGEPDLREILQGRLEDPVDELDENGNWMLDWAENDQGEPDSAQNLRCGLHAPGYNGRDAVGGVKTLLIDHVQIVRHLMTYDDADAIVLEDVYSLEKVVVPGDPGVPNPDGSCTECQKFHTSMVDWGTWDGESTYGTGQQREIIIAIRNPDDTQEDRDVIPTSAERVSKLDLLRAFAFRYAGCIDYIQVGNESFEGSGAYLDGANGTELMALYNTDFTSLLALGLTWIEDQAEAVRIGSALSGRPLRLITPGFPVGTVNTGADGDVDGSYGNTPAGEKNKRARAINDDIVLANDHRMFFDTHIHYLTVSQASSGITNVTDAQSAWGTEGNTPALRAVCEFGPKGDKDDAENEWESEFQDKVDLFFNPNSDVERKWEPFIKDVDDPTYEDGWEQWQFGSNGFQLETLLTSLLQDDYVVVCYGPTLQRGANSTHTFNIASLRGSKIKEDNYEKIDNADEFTPTLLYTDGEGWEDIINDPDFLIGSFEPHCSSCNDCSEDKACPSCGE